MIKFNEYTFTRKDLDEPKKALLEQPLEGSGKYNGLCSRFIEREFKVPLALTTSSCTASLEMMALILGLRDGDEIIMPSYTFVTSASSFVRTGCKPVFVDINLNDLNLDEEKIESSITDRTKAILIVHYAGVACNISKIKKIAKKYNLYLLEDAAQSFGSKYREKYLGTFGDLSAFSFHGTKNISCGEGGALIVNNKSLIRKTYQVFDKGTNRQDFLDKKVDKYSWVELGSSFTMSNFSAALLYSQLRKYKTLNRSRLRIWNYYFKAFSKKKKDIYSLLSTQKYKIHNGHIFFLLFKQEDKKEIFLNEMTKRKIQCTTHYVPLHNSLFGEKISRTAGKMHNTIYAHKNLVRLPLWVGVDYKRVAKESLEVLKEINEGSNNTS